MKNNSIFKMSLFKEDSNKDLLVQFKKDYLETELFLRSILFYHTHSNDIDDLVQEAYLKAWKGYSKFNKQASFKTWIYTIAMNCVKDHYKTKSKKLDINYDLETNDKVLEQDLIIKGLARLTEEQREVFVLHYYLSYTFEEMGQMVEKPVSTMKSQAYKARDEFIQFLKANGVQNG